MRLLLDTHTFIWWDSDPSKLSPVALSMIQNPDTILTLSVASVWEIQIKFQLKKLKLDLPISEVIESQQRINNLEILPIKLNHVLALEKLPPSHKDPFDRLLVAQAIIEEVAIISHDPIFAKYPIQTIW